MILLQCIKLTKPECLTDVTCAVIKKREFAWLKLYGIVSFAHWIDLFFAVPIHYFLKKHTWPTPE